jgi:hypothetical protein
MLIAMLLHRPWRDTWQPAELGRSLGYTAMTASRAARELTDAGLVTAHTRGRTRLLHVQHPPRATWERATPLLQSPVTRRAWVQGSIQPPPRLAGLSALARLTDLADPSVPVYAVTTSQWRDATAAGLTMEPEPAPGGSAWEVWRYSTTLSRAGDTVDPLSLLLSVRDDTDERVQLAVQQVEEQLPW